MKVASRPEKTRPQETAGPEPVWLRPGGFALLLAAMVWVAFPRVLSGAGTFFARDFGLFSCPVAYYQRECFWRGELPFWNPYNYCGIPFLAQLNAICLYPPTLIYLLLPFPWSLNFFCLLHLWFGGVGMYWLAQRWTADRLAAAAAGVVFAFNGLSLNFLIWPSHIATFSWMPCVILAVERAWRQGGRWLILAPLAGAMQLLSGGPETILFTWLLSLGLWGVGLADDGASVTQRRDPRVIRARRLGLVAVLTFGLAAAQMLPFLDLAAHSQRDLGFAEAAGSMAASGWANFLVPMAFGQILPEKFFLQAGQQWTSSYYVGVGTLVLALLALWNVRDGRVWLLAGAAVAASLCALGEHTFVYPTLQRVIPELTLMTYPVKFVIVVVFAAPLLAACGVAWARTAPREMVRITLRRELVLGTVLLGLIGAILLWAWRNPTPGADFSATLTNGLSRAGFLAASLLVLFLLQQARSPARGCVRPTNPSGKHGLLAPFPSSRGGEPPTGWGEKGGFGGVMRLKNQGGLSLALLAVFWLDLWTHEPPQNPVVPPSVFTPGQAQAELGLQPPPLLGQSRVMVSPAAKMKFNDFAVKDAETEQIARRIGFFCNCNLLDNTPKVDGFFSLSPEEFDTLFSALYYVTKAECPRLEDFLSVSHITAPGELTEWAARTTWLPMVTAGQKPLFLEPAATLRRLIQPDFDASQVVLLPPNAESWVAATHQTEARVVSVRFEPQQVDLTLTNSETSLVVISQTYYHWWRAYVDEQPAPLLRANYAFQAVPVPAGQHRVRLVYRDRSFQIGLIISAAALLGCGVAWWRLGMGSGPL